MLQRYSSPSTLEDDNDSNLSLSPSSSSGTNTSPRVRFELNTIPVVKRRKLNCWGQLDNKKVLKMDEERRSYSPGASDTNFTEENYRHKRQHSSNTYDAAQTLINSKGTTIDIISRSTNINSVGPQMIIKEQENEQNLAHTSSMMTDSKSTSPPSSFGSISTKRLTSASSLFPYLPVDLPLFVKSKSPEYDCAESHWFGRHYLCHYRVLVSWRLNDRVS